MQRLQIDDYSTEHLLGLRIESVFPMCSQDAAMAHCCPFVPMPALSSGFSPSLKVGAEEAGQGPAPWVQLRAAELFLHRGREGSK